AEYGFDDGVQLFAEVLATEFDIAGATTPPFLQGATIPTTNAFNPFGVAVSASGTVIGAEKLGQFSLSDQVFRPLIGVRGKLGTWDWETTALYSRDSGDQIVYGQTNAAALTAALASSDPRTALNPFVDGPMASPAVLGAIFNQVNFTHWVGDAT